MSWQILAPMLAFSLGLRHGMDPDHLAAIDGLTRYNAGFSPRLARWAGMLFSLGHGMVVVVAAVLLGTVFHHSMVPRWTAISGTLISVSFLFLLGGLNIRAAWQSEGHRHFRPIGLRADFFRRFFRVGHPLPIFGVGALFAISFDTLTQATLFSLAGSKAAAWEYSALLGIVFMLGMMTPDSLNGLWIARLVRQADRRARIASRVLGGTFGIVSLLIGMIELGQALSPTFGSATGAWELLIGCAVLAATAVGFRLALKLAARSEVTKQGAFR